MSTFCFMLARTPRPTLFPYTTLFRSAHLTKYAVHVRVLVVDNYDSFVYNLVQYLAQLGADCHVRRNNVVRSEEHTSELQSRGHLVCRLLLEKKKIQNQSKN